MEEIIKVVVPLPVVGARSRPVLGRSGRRVAGPELATSEGVGVESPATWVFRFGAEELGEREREVAAGDERGTVARIVVERVLGQNGVACRGVRGVETRGDGLAEGGGAGGLRRRANQAASSQRPAGQPGGRARTRGRFNPPFPHEWKHVRTLGQEVLAFEHLKRFEELLPELQEE